MIEFLQTLDWAKPSWDLFIILSFVVMFLMYGLSLGRDRLVIIMVAMYMALAVINTAPYIEGWNGVQAVISINGASVLKITMFFGLFLVLFFLVSRSALMNTLSSSNSAGSLWQMMVFSFMQVGLMISIALSYLPEAFSESISWQLRNVFISDPAQFAWLVGPILVMAAVKSRKKDED